MTRMLAYLDISGYFSYIDLLIWMKNIWLVGRIAVSFYFEFLNVYWHISMKLIHLKIQKSMN